jgi:hypothetical protein
MWFELILGYGLRTDATNISLSTKYWYVSFEFTVLSYRLKIQCSDVPVDIVWKESLCLYFPLRNHAVTNITHCTHVHFEFTIRVPGKRS